MPQRKRTGRIAQLPRPVRDQVNGLMNDGKPYDQILTWLAANGHSGISPHSLSEWRKGGFQDWLEDQATLSHLEKFRELCGDIVSQNDHSKTHEATLHVLATRLCHAFLKFDPDKLADRLATNPEYFSTLANTFTRLSRRSTELDLIKDYLQQQEERRRKELESKSKDPQQLGLSDEAADIMERRLKLA